MKRILSICLVITAIIASLSIMNTKMLAQGKNGYDIYPVPQKQVIGEESVDMPRMINIVAESGIDDVTKERAEQILADYNIKKAVEGSNLYLGVAGSKGVADVLAEKLKLDRSIFKLQKYDRHILAIRSNGDIIILGENTDAVFCGLASLEQILESAASASCSKCKGEKQHEKGKARLKFQTVVIYDYADVKERGIIEGYYGVPYSAEVTKDLFRFMAKYKMNTYMYGAKSDPYHSRFWSTPYPTQISEQEEKIGYLTQDMMKDITSVAASCKVNFIWAIHPGKAFADPENTQIISQIMKKFESMHSLGVRQFGVFVDDVGVPKDDAVLDLCAKNLTDLQNAIDQKWNTDSQPKKDNVKPLQYVPQLYAYGWVSLEEGERFFKSLAKVPSKVNIYITGKNVWSVPNKEDIELVRDWLGGRNVSWWWNYVCNDQDMTKIFTADMFTNFRDETHIVNTLRPGRDLDHVNTVILNPMQQGELSKIGLFSVADYTWNLSAFNNELSWEAAVKGVLGKKWSKDFRNIASSLRYYDSDALGYLVMRYKQSVGRGKPAPGALIEELQKINESCARLVKMKDSPNESDRLFYNDLRPWLLKLKAMSEEAMGLLEGKNPERIDYKENPDFRFEILGGMGEHISFAIRTAEPSAEVLEPFIYWLREQK